MSPRGMGPMRGGHGAQKAKNFKGTMLQLTNYLKPFRLVITCVIIFAACSAGFSIVGPKILGMATTKLFEGVMSYMGGTGLSVDMQFISRCLVGLLALYSVSSGFAYLQAYLMSGVSMDITYQLRKRISEKINRLPLKYFDTRTHGEVLSRITNDVDTVNQTLNQSLTQMITSATTLVGILIMMFTISPLMTAVTFLILPLSMSLIMLVVKHSQRFFAEQQRSLGNLNGHIEEMYSGHNVVQVFNGEQEAIETFQEINKKLYSSAWISQFLSGMMMPIMQFVGNLGYVAVCILGGFLAIRRVIEVGDIQAFIQYVRNFTQPIAQLANISNTLQSTAAAAERIFEFLSEEEEIPETSAPVILEKVEGHVIFKNVKFGYAENKTIIHNFSADIKPGQRVAIVGPTGAGKSTIIKLLMRFYDINDGMITIDGHELRDFTRAGLRSIFGMVLQDTWLYNASIKENIRYGTWEATDVDIVKAATEAHCNEFIRTLPDGYETVLNESASNISQGQKQLLTIARTLLSNPKILILDEATSSVDTRTEVLIQKAMNHLMEGKTSFVIAHRLSTIRDADLILVMKGGDIIEQGTHHELLEKKGFYEELYMSQFADKE